MTCSTIITTICIALLFVIIVSVCDARIGAVIIFERKNILAGSDEGVNVDVGHVGIAFENPDDGSWIGGAVEATSDSTKNTVGIAKGQENGGWNTEAGTFKTQNDVIEEFFSLRTKEADRIKPHLAYDRMKFIAVQHPDYNKALLEIRKFYGRGYKWYDNNCLNGIYDVMVAYNVEGLSAPFPGEYPRNYFKKLKIGVELQSINYQQQEPSMVNPQTESKLQQPVYLSDLHAYRDTFGGGINYDSYGGMEIANIKYDRGVQLECDAWGGSHSASFNLNGEYTQLKGLVGLDDLTRNSQTKTKILFQGDGRDLQTIEMLPGDFPSNVDIDVSGVSRLDVTVSGETAFAIIDLIDMALTNTQQPVEEGEYGKIPLENNIRYLPKVTAKGTSMSPIDPLYKNHYLGYKGGI